MNVLLYTRENQITWREILILCTDHFIFRLFCYGNVIYALESVSLLNKVESYLAISIKSGRKADLFKLISIDNNLGTVWVVPLWKRAWVSSISVFRLLILCHILCDQRWAGQPADTFWSTLHKYCPFPLAEDEKSSGLLCLR